MLIGSQSMIERLGFRVAFKYFSCYLAVGLRCVTEPELGRLLTELILHTVSSDSIASIQNSIVQLSRGGPTAPR
jgi:hypothetical protein